MPQVTFSDDLVPAAGYSSRYFGRERATIGVVSVPTTWLDNVDDIILFPPIPANACIFEFSIAHDDLGGAGFTWDLGLTNILGQDVNPGGGGGAPDSRECFANAIATAGLQRDLTNQRFTILNDTTVDNFAWQLAGMLSDPGGVLYPCFRPSAVDTPIVGNLIYRYRYAVA